MRRRPGGGITWLNRQEVRYDNRNGVHTECLCEQARQRFSKRCAEGLAAMTDRGVRRAPVVDQGGNLVGIVTIDDLLTPLARNLTALAGLITAQPAHEVSMSAL